MKRTLPVLAMMVLVGGGGAFSFFRGAGTPLNQAPLNEGGANEKFESAPVSASAELSGGKPVAPSRGVFSNLLNKPLTENQKEFLHLCLHAKSIDEFPGENMEQKVRAMLRPFRAAVLGVT